MNGGTREPFLKENLEIIMLFNFKVYNNIIEFSIG